MQNNNRMIAVKTDTLVLYSVEPGLCDLEYLLKCLDTGKQVRGKQLLTSCPPFAIKFLLF